LTFKKAKQKRKLVLSPDFGNKRSTSGVMQKRSRARNQAACFDEIAKKECRGFLLCFSPACTLPRYFAKCKLTYFSGVSAPAQVLTTVPGIPRTTASATEHKEFTPVVLSHRACPHSIAAERALRIEGIAALGARCQRRIDQYRLRLHR